MSIECNSIIIDKVDMHIALDLSTELTKIAELIQGDRKPAFKVVMTTQFKGTAEDGGAEQAIKKAFMGDKKALIIQINEDQRVKGRFERIE
jgi:hypothetical protein